MENGTMIRSMCTKIQFWT